MFALDAAELRKGCFQAKLQELVLASVVFEVVLSAPNVLLTLP